jgi:hypothetical protein
MRFRLLEQVLRRLSATFKQIVRVPAVVFSQIVAGAVAEKSEMTIPESPEVRCLSRFRNCQTENSGIAAGAIFFSIPEWSKLGIP